MEEMNWIRIDEVKDYEYMNVEKDLSYDELLSFGEPLEYWEFVLLSEKYKEEFNIIKLKDYWIKDFNGIPRVCWLSGIDIISYFGAGVRGIDGNGGALRGVIVKRKVKLR